MPRCQGMEAFQSGERATEERSHLPTCPPVTKVQLAPVPPVKPEADHNAISRDCPVSCHSGDFLLLRSDICASTQDIPHTRSHRKYQSFS